jgi:hypothetical protein
VNKPEVLLSDRSSGVIKIHRSVYFVQWAGVRNIAQNLEAVVFSKNILFCLLLIF